MKNRTKINIEFMDGLFLITREQQYVWVDALELKSKRARKLRQNFIKGHIFALVCGVREG